MIQNTFSIGDTSRLSGASKKQIRNWEAAGYIPKAERVVCGDRAYRRFTREQIEIIRTIKGYLDEGFTLRAAAKKAADLNPVSKGVKRYA
jgi:DNA-binding transcriptional MerR regulator